ncbi:MAG TPA: hypothetical protein VFZ21_14815 [Gemmatimonadaceae bacterium]|jgi:hypothetical protein|nr:hypothetical protein [Gemmatimonadaceae bacterium]
MPARDASIHDRHVHVREDARSGELIADVGHAARPAGSVVDCSAPNQDVPAAALSKVRCCKRGAVTGGVTQRWVVREVGWANSTPPSVGQKPTAAKS